MKIVDASAILAVLLDEAERAAVEVLLANERLVAPHLLLFEVANKCAIEARRSPDKKHHYIDALTKFLDLNIELRDADIVGTFVLADMHELTAYDASYLWLARELDVELVTLDQDLLALLHAP
jgi:predicted nucleic acid-binding protein